MKYLFTYIILFVFYIPLFAQNNPKKDMPTIDDVMKQMENIKTDNKPNTASKSNKSSTKPNSTARSTKDFYFNKKMIDEHFSKLTAEEKSWFSNIPPIPERFYTSNDAQEFLKKSNGFSMIKFLSEHSTKNIQIISFISSLEKVMVIARLIVAAGENSKLEFEKNNPWSKAKNYQGAAYASSNTAVYLPMAEASFADGVVSTNYGKGDKQQDKNYCIGRPDYVNDKSAKIQKNVYSLGVKGDLVIQFTDNVLVDVNGPDLFVFEEGQIEPTKIEISKDGSTWLNVGEISGGTASVDISAVAKPNDYFYYVRFTDLNTSSGVPGADIDAVAAIGSAIKLNLNSEVLFETGKAVLNNNGIAEIKKLVANIKTTNAATIQVNGYTDNVGDQAANIKLSQARANAVAEILQKEIADKNKFSFVVQGLGEANPIAPNTTVENKQKNRRVEIIIVPK